ncbi:hypothetical protein AG1IA_06475 [Rhizoctonia solani AG-1 IA]|uniref:Beta-galactosidase jelly roll domain-containing protein n=1 Tax=Thanatephorus cucumeris (strain AG1-IA) TaxID=983506 RepID=L8WND4_THACA|nr:hypothetical protein AG1IA_06475 [Rhizoctonia solani AG-1 IA]
MDDGDQDYDVPPCGTSAAGWEVGLVCGRIWIPSRQLVVPRSIRKWGNGRETLCSRVRSLSIIMMIGFNFGFSAFLNGAFLGSGQGRPESDPSGGTDLVNVTYTFPVGSIQRDNILTVVVDNMGIHENWNANDEFKAPRGIRGYELLGSGDFTSWKLTGNVDGENTKDIIRGPLHEGGLYVERIGAIFPNYKFTSAWNSSKTDASCSPYVGINKAGIKAYKTKFNLSIDQSTDVTVAFKLDRNPNSNYRARLYVNGWQFGR